MDAISPKRAGLATAITATTLYAACAVVLLSVPRTIATTLYDSFFHGLDVTGLVQQEFAWGPTLLGIVGFFALGWIIGAWFAVVYNWLGHDA